MFAVLLAFAYVHSAPVIWAESSLVNVFQDSLPSEGATNAIRLYAARGERESFQLCVRSDVGLQGLVVSAEGIGPGIGKPKIYRVGYVKTSQSSRRAFGEQALLPDPLLEPVSSHVMPDTTAVFWIAYDVPSDATPGVRKGKVVVVAEKSRKLFVDVTLEIFDFQLTGVNALPVRAVLDRSAISAFYGLNQPELDLWAPFYESVLAAKLTPTISQMKTPDDLLPVARNGEVSTERFQQHLEFLIQRDPRCRIEIVDPNSGVSLFPSPADLLKQDPLQLYLLDMHVWLEKRGVLEKVFVVPSQLPDRSKWGNVREIYFRVRRADPNIRRLLIGPPHPFFERYTEIWATPLRCYHPVIWGRWKKGMSLAAEVPYRSKYITASSCGSSSHFWDYATLPEDAYDGSIFTAWVSQHVPTPRNPEWIEVYFEDPVRTDKLSIGWLHGHEGESIRIKTSADGTVFGDANVVWKHYLPMSRYDADWSEGSFKMVKTFRAIRVEFLSSRHNTPVSVTELELGVAPNPETIAAIDPIEPWLSLTGQDFPALSPDVHPIESRSIPWVCWRTDASGLMLGPINGWTNEWKDYLDGEPPVTWDAERVDMTSVLFYPGSNGLIPSIRSERLRDGLEDYEYLQLIPRDDQGRVVEDFSPILPRVARGNFARTRNNRDWLAEPPTFSPDQPVSSLDNLADELLGVRVALGRALSKRSHSDVRQR